MTDLVKRLRIPLHERDAGYVGVQGERKEAADEIERLHEIIEQRSIANRKVVIEDMREWAKAKWGHSNYRNDFLNALDTYCKDQGIK